MKCWSLSRDRLPLVPCAWLLLSCTGCAWMPSDSERAEFLEPPAMEHTLSATSTAARPGTVVTSLREWPDPQWWHEFHSPTLDALMETAFTMIVHAVLITMPDNLCRSGVMRATGWAGVCIRWAVKVRRPATIARASSGTIAPTGPLASAMAVSAVHNRPSGIR